MSQAIVVIQSLEQLKQEVKKAMDEQGVHADLNHLDVSRLNELDSVFVDFPQFNGDISKWDVSNVEGGKEADDPPTQRGCIPEGRRAKQVRPFSPNT